MPATAVGAATLRWAGQQDIFSLDPYSHGSTSSLAFLNHEGLVRYTPSKVEPVVIHAGNKPRHWLTRMAG
jgi:peptide/nickel transport system substrate-binding protein